MPQLHITTLMPSKVWRCQAVQQFVSHHTTSVDPVYAQDGFNALFRQLSIFEGRQAFALDTSHCNTGDALAGMAHFNPGSRMRLHIALYTPHPAAGNFSASVPNSATATTIFYARIPLYHVHHPWTRKQNAMQQFEHDSSSTPSLIIVRTSRSCWTSHSDSTSSLTTTT